MFNILELFDEKFITNSILISIVGIFAFFLIFRGFLKYSSNLKVFFIATIVYTFVYVTGVTVYYIYKNEYIFSNQTKYYIYGKIQKIDEENNIIRMAATRSTLDSGGTGIITVKLTKNTVYYAQIDGEEVSIQLSDLRANASIEVMCGESQEMDNKVTAVKITRTAV